MGRSGKEDSEPVIKIKAAARTTEIPGSAFAEDRRAFCFPREKNRDSH
jgi:hypothetical protein